MLATCHGHQHQLKCAALYQRRLLVHHYQEKPMCRSRWHNEGRPISARGDRFRLRSRESTPLLSSVQKLNWTFCASYLAWIATRPTARSESVLFGRMVTADRGSNSNRSMLSSLRVDSVWVRIQYRLCQSSHHWSTFLNALVKNITRALRSLFPKDFGDDSGRP